MLKQMNKGAGTSCWHYLRGILTRLSILFSFLSFVQAQENARIEIGGKWQLDCPQVGYRAPQDQLSVTWTQNNAIWVKIEHSNVSIAEQLVSLQRSRMGYSNILNIACNNFRYKFYYDEMIGDFRLTISNAESEDSGRWVCYLTIERARDGAIEEFTSDGNLVVGKGTPILYDAIDDPDADVDDDGAHGAEYTDDNTPTQRTRKPNPTKHTTAIGHHHHFGNETGNGTSINAAVSALSITTAFSVSGASSLNTITITLIGMYLMLY